MRRGAALALFLLFLGAVQALGNVTAIRIVNPTRVPDLEFLRLFRPAVGDPYDAAEVRRSLALLTMMPGVQNVLVRLKETAEGTEIGLEVVPEPLVRNIDFSGLKHLDEDELLAGFHTRADGPAFRPFLDADAEDVKKRYAEEGYAEARVTAEIVPTSRAGWVDVAFRVEEGEPLRVAAYGGLGEADRFGRERVLELLGMEKGEIASEERLRQGVKKLLDACREEGYPEARVAKAWFEPKPEPMTLHLDLVLGQAAKIEVRGDRSDALEEIVRERLGEPVDGTWVGITAKRFRESLAEEGYVNAEVRPGEERDDKGMRVVVFDVRSGVQAKLHEVKFRGNASLDAGRLLDVMKADDTEYLSAPPLRRSVLDADMQLIRQYYATEGFISAQASVADVTVDEKGRTVAVVAIEEGLRYRFRTIRVATDGGLTEAEALPLTGLKAGAPANPVLVDKARVLLLAELSKKGYTQASVEQEVAVSPTEPKVDVTLKITSGLQRLVGSVVVSGNARTESEVILRELSFERGKPLNSEDILTSRRRLYRLGFFQDVQIAPVGEPRADGSVDIAVTVREQNAGRIDYGFGYGTEEGPTAFLEIGHSNIQGMGRSLSLRVETQGHDRTYAINFREPWLFDRPYDLRLSLLRQRVKRDTYTLDATAFQTALDREIIRSLRASLVYTLEENRLSDVDPGAILTSEDAKPYLLSSLGPLLVWDSRDDPFNPTTGYHHSFQAEWASDVIGSDINFVKYLAMLSGFYSVDRFSLALLARGGLADFFGREADLPVNKRFYLGGRSTVRGFARDQVGPKAADGTPIGGDVMANLKAELRVGVYKDFGIALFWDAGQVWIRKEDKVDWGDLRHAAGWGLRYNTPVGPISIDVGYKLDRQKGETPYEWYFTVGNIF